MVLILVGDLDMDLYLYVVSVSLSVSVCETQPNALRTLPMQYVFFRGSYVALSLETQQHSFKISPQQVEEHRCICVNAITLVQ